jgi:8-oxo-dGTP pyrophosphatase MutT (NUDIX family)
MIRRKDSMSFAEILRGKYDPDNLAYLETLVANMTQSEQAMLKTLTFEEIWKQSWGEDHMTAEFTQARDKFNSVDMEALIRTCPSPYPEPEWGFPKGRRIRAETDVECAIREFNEETNIPREAYTLLRNVVLEETFTGLNGIEYRHVYFVALLNPGGSVDLTQRFTYMQRREISGIGWKTLNQCIGFVRPHHLERRKMLDALKTIVETYESE